MYLVTGATGDLGRRIVRLLREENTPVRAFVRLTSRYKPLEEEGAEIFIGDLKRDRDIQKACQGVKYVISAHGSNEARGGALDLDYRANIDLIDSAKEAGVEHFVFISVLGADREYEDSPVFKAKRQVEKYLEKSGLNYTILRPSGFASNLLPLAERFRQTGIYLSIGNLKNRTSVVSTDDLAQIAVDSVMVEGARNQIIPVGGPKVLAREEVPQIFSRIFNKEPIILNPPIFLLDGVRTAIGFFNPELQKSLGTLQVLLDNEFFCSAEEIERLETLFDFQLESLENFVRRYLGA